MNRRSFFRLSAALAPLSTDTSIKAWTDSSGGSLIGPIDGNNKIFTLSHIPDPVRVHVYRNGLHQRGGGFDYTLTGNNAVTFTSPPFTGDTIDIDAEGKFTA